MVAHNMRMKEEFALDRNMVAHNMRMKEEFANVPPPYPGLGLVRCHGPALIFYTYFLYALRSGCVFF